MFIYIFIVSIFYIWFTTICIGSKDIWYTYAAEVKLLLNASNVHRNVYTHKSKTHNTKVVMRARPQIHYRRELTLCASNPCQLPPPPPPFSHIYGRYPNIETHILYIYFVGYLVRFGLLLPFSNMRCAVETHPIQHIHSTSHISIYMKYHHQTF